MPPRRNVNKGKAPMVEEQEHRSTGSSTRSRAEGIVLREARQVGARITEELVEVPVQEIPAVEDRDDQQQVNEENEPRAEEGDEQMTHDMAGPSNTTGPNNVAGPSSAVAPTVEDMMANPMMSRFMQMIMGTMNEMCQNMRQEMIQMFEAQHRTSSNPTPPERPGVQIGGRQMKGAQTDGRQPTRRQIGVRQLDSRNDEDVRIIGASSRAEEQRRQLKEERADKEAVQNMYPPAFKGEMDYKLVDE